MNSGLLNAAPIYFTEEVGGASTFTASAITSIIGWMSVTCFVGGWLSDQAMKRRGIRGRCYVQLFNLTVEGLLIFVFGFMRTFPASASLFVVSSLFTNWSLGSLYALMPYVDREVTGAVSGIAGFFGSLGGVLVILLTHTFDDPGPFCEAFVILACAILLSALLSLFLILSNNVPDHVTLDTEDDSIANNTN